MINLFVLIQQEEVPFSESVSLSRIEGIKHFTTKEIVISKEITQEMRVESQTIIGPKLDAPTQAIQGFVEKYKNHEGEVSKNEKNYIFTTKEQIKTAKEVAEEIICQKMEEISKSWKQKLDVLPIEWSRPIHSISAFLDGKEFKSKFSLNSVSFKKAQKIVSKGNSKQVIERKIEEFEQKHGVVCILKKLIHELSWLYEDPEFLEAEIPTEYLNLPKEVLVLTIASNQKYLLFLKDGNIYPKFLIVGKRASVIILQGHLRTLKARLEDAQYYINQDLKTFNTKSIEPNLEKIIFHQKYGSVAKRVLAMQEIAQVFFPNDFLLQQAIAVSKNDLTSKTVQSFTELQGYCGGVFLERNGVEPKIFEAISQHYKPLNPNDSLPQSELACKLSFVDKLQKINALAEIGEIPTSSRDPFAIRRDILSIIRICNSQKWNFRSEIIHKSLENFVHERVKLFAKDFLDENKREAFLKNFQTNGRFY